VLGVIGINILLTVVLITIFARNLKLIKSKITLGMIFFATAFLLENVMSLYFYNDLLMHGINFITTFNLVVKLFEMAGLMVLLYVTWK
jgi:hypothetical protein